MSRSSRAFGRSLAASLLVELAGCSHSLPLPPTGPHIEDVPQIVPFPPPPARVEIVPPAPKPDAVWVDGEWQWRGRRWVWQPGGWQVPPQGAYFAPSVTVRLSDGQLAWFRGQWQHAPRAAYRGER